MNDDFFSELNTVMNYFALVDNCQSTNHHTIQFGMDAMPKIEKLIKEELQYEQNRNLFSQLEEIFFPSRTVSRKGSA